MKIGVCIRAKDEIIIKDWVNHYLKLGFDRIIIYDNMSNPPIQECIQECKDSERVQIIIDPFKGSNQCVLYKKCLDNNKDLDWLLLCDADEFIYCKDGTIKDFLSNFSQDTCSILINWLVYGTSNLEHYNHTQTVFQQFTQREDYNNFWNCFVKSFIRPNLIENIGTVHITYNNNYKIKNVYHETLYGNFHDKCDFKDHNLSDNTPVVMVHYMLIDFENMLRKRKKNIEGDLLWEPGDIKYSREWYATCNFKENNYDPRILN